MIRIYLVVFFVFLTLGYGYSQSAKDLVFKVRELRFTDADSAMKVAAKAAAALKKKPDHYLSANLFNAVGTIYTFRGDFESADSSFNQGLFYARKANNDTLQIFILNNQGMLHMDYMSFESSLRKFTSALKIASRKKIYREMGDTYNNIGNLYKYYDKFDSSLMAFHRGFDAYEKEKERPSTAESGKSDIKSNIGYVYASLGKYTLALENFFHSLNYFEKTKAWDKAALTANNICDVYIFKENYKKAAEYSQLALKYDRKKPDKQTTANTYFNIGKIKQQEKEIDSAIFYYLAAEHIYKEMDLIFMLPSVYNSLGTLYSDLNDLDKSLEYFNKAIEVNNYYGDSTGLSYNYYNVSFIYLKKDRINEAKKFIDMARSTIIGDNRFSLYIDIYHLSSEIYARIGNYKSAFEFITIRNSYKDSLTSETQIRQQEEIEAIYQNEKKAKDLELQKSLNDKQSLELEHAEKEKQVQAYQIQLMMLGGFVLLIFIVIVIRTSLIRKRNNRILAEKNSLIYQQKAEVEKQKDELTLKNHIIEEKQKEIIDSITYAKRLQQAILPQKSEIDRYLPHNFLLYKPKDIVAGDFYFFETTPTHFFYAACDCTGHGVPGAMVSIVCSNALTRSVKEFGLTDPGKILDKTRELILETYHKSSEEVKDGMDISLISIAMSASEQSEKNGSSLSHSIFTLSWAGANNPLWYIENGEMKEIKADKQPIGRTENPKPFTTHEIPRSISSLFLFTDGFADQFGGDKGKKFKYSNLQALLLNHHRESPEMIKNKLEIIFEDWKRDLEQVDDVCVIGIQF